MRAPILALLSVLALLLGSLVMDAQQKKPLWTTTRIDTFIVSVPKPMTATVVIQTQVGRRVQQVPRTINYVGWVQLIRVDTTVMQTFAYDIYPDTVYGQLTTGQVVPIQVTEGTNRTVVTVRSQYFDVNWRAVPTPVKFMQDAQYAKPERVQ